MADKENTSKEPPVDDGRPAYGVAFNRASIERFSQLLRDGLIEAASAHEQAVQDNVVLSSETKIRLTTHSSGSKEVGLSSEIEGKAEATIKINKPKP